MRKSIFLLLVLTLTCLVACGDSDEKIDAVKSTQAQLEERSSEMPSTSESEELSERTFETSDGISFYFELEPVDEVAFSLLKAEYDKIDFTAEFEVGDRNTYDTYFQIYRQLMSNERSYWDEDGKERYLRDIVPEADMESRHFYVFDVDGDGKQELYMRSFGNRIYVFKYTEADEKIHVWYQEKNTPYYYLVGTQTKIWFNGDGLYEFYKLDKDANEEITVSFEYFHDMNPATQEGEFVYLVKLPEYTDESLECEMAAELQKQAYCIDGEYTFCVTRDQYDDLTLEFFEIYKKMEAELEEVEIPAYPAEVRIEKLYEMVQQKINKTNKECFKKPDYFGTTLFTEDKFEEIKQYEMNIVLEYLGIKHWNRPTNSWDEIDLPVDDPLGDYTPEKLLEYTDEKHDITVEYFCGGCRLQNPENRYIALVIKEYKNDRVDNLYYQIIDYGYLGVMTGENYYYYETNEMLEDIDRKKIERGDIGHHVNMWLDEANGEVNLIYDIGEEERENQYGGTYTSYAQSIWVKVEETQTGYKVKEIIPMTLCGGI